MAMSAAARGRPHYNRGDHSIPDTPEARRHASEAEQLKAAMIDYEIHPERVAPTLDGKGHVRLDFPAMHWILDMLDEAYNGVPPVLRDLH